VDNLVTISGECFGAEFERKEVASDRDGVYYLFRLKDLSESDRGELLVSLFGFGPDKAFVPDYDSRIESVRLNLIRRAFDAVTVSFDRPNEPHRYQMLSLTPDDFKVRASVGDEQIREYIKHKAYWLGYRLGSVAKKLLVQFDVEFDLDYLGATSEDVRRNVWLLGERGLLRKTEFPGVSVPTAELVQEYESKGRKTSSDSTGGIAVTSSVPLDDLLAIPRRGQLDQDLLKLSLTVSGDSPLTILWIDLDHFKPVNDTYGHAAGDEVLKKVTSAIKRTCQGKGQLYRYGGDELIVILPNHSVREATATAERIREAISDSSFVNCPVNVTASVGVACCPETAQDPNLLLEQADKAMYEVKGSGGNGVQVWNGTFSEGSPSAGARARKVQTDIASRVEAAELWISLQQAQHPGFILLIENKSDDEVTIESITLKCGTLHLCPPSKPAKLDELELPARSKKQISSWTPSVSPTSTLRLKQPHLKDGQPIDIDIVVRGRVLERVKNFSQTILATIDYVNHRMTQFGG